MNFGFLFIFLLIQVAVNRALTTLLGPLLENQYGLIAYYLLSSIIIAFFGALFNTPAGYKKDFYKHPGFHKMMMLYFVIFFALDLMFFFVF